MARDIFQQDVTGSYCANDAVDFGPEVAGVSFTATSARYREGLTRITCRKYIDFPKLITFYLLYITNDFYVGPVTPERFL